MLPQRQLGQLSVSALGLGCMGMSEFYGDTDEQQALSTLRLAHELGVTFFDTADMYGVGANEQLVGKALKPIRHKILLATKFGLVRDGTAAGRGINCSPEYVRQACDASLQRLGFEYIDLYYMHRLDPNTPIEETVGAMAELVKAGKVRHLGLSEVDADTLRRAHAVHPITAVQTEYSLMTRSVEQNGVLATCRELGIGFVPYSPLSRGLLAARYQGGESFAENDFRRNMPRFQGDNLRQNIKLVEAFKDFASQKSCSPAQLCLAWVLAQGDDIVPIPGTKREKYLRDNVGAVDVNLSKSDLAALDKLLQSHGVHGDRYAPELMKAFRFKE